MAHHGVVRIYKMEKLFSLLILTFLVFSTSVSYAKEDLTETLNNAYSEHDRRKTNARRSAEQERRERIVKRVSVNIENSLNNTQHLYWFIDNIRYKAQLLEEKLRSGDLRNSHRAAQVHWKDLLNVVSTRLPIDRANASKLYTYQEELDRAKNKLEWLYTFKSYVVGMESFNDIEYNQDELKATKEYVNKQVTVATTIKTSALSNTLKYLEKDILRRLNKKLANADVYLRSIINKIRKIRIERRQKEAELTRREMNMVIKIKRLFKEYAISNRNL